MIFDRFDRYIARNVLGAMVLVQVTLLALDFSLSLIQELSDAGPDYGFVQMLAYQSMRLPWRFYQYIPIGVLLGGLLGLGTMASSNELTAIRAAGRSLARIVWGAMKPLMLVILVTMAIGEWVAPKTEQYADAYRIEHVRGKGEMDSESGGWQVEGEDVYRFGTIRADSTLLGITRYHYHNKQLLSVMHADSANWNEQAHHWILHGVRRTDIHEDRTDTSQADQESWDTAFSPEFLTLVLMNPQSQSIQDLWKFGVYLDQQGTGSNTTWLNFWMKTLQPLSLMGLLLLAASFVFGPLRSVAAGTRIFYGIVVGLLFKYAQDLLAPSSILFGFAPLWAVLVPITFCWILGVVLIRRRS